MQITVTEAAAREILRRRGVALDELPKSVQARLIHKISEQAALQHTTVLSIASLEESLNDDIPANDAGRHQRQLASLNKKNADFWRRA